MEDLYHQKIINANNLFTDSSLDIRTLYLYRFNELPSVSFINNIDSEKSFRAVKEKFMQMTEYIHQGNWFQLKSKKYRFDKAIIVLNNKCILEFDNGYCEILHDGKQEEFVNELTGVISQFRERQRRELLEINLIVQSRGRLTLTSMEIKRIKLDLNLFYEDDFKEVDQVIRKRLSRKKDKGIVLLHGLPGTGKTTYLRYLVGKIKKRVLFVSPAVAGNLADPEFIQLLIDNPDTILIIEDAENIIMDRKFNSASSVSNLLNISDGLLADFLNVQLICTFNNSLTAVDSALMRKGRLIARYEFGKLGITKAQQLSNYLGNNTIITQPMTVAEIANQHEKEQKENKIEIIGFRAAMLEN